MSHLAGHDLTLLRLYDMIRFYAVFFLHFMEGLTKLEHEVNKRFVAHEPLDQARLESWQRFLKNMRTQSEQIGLRTLPAYLAILQAGAASGRSLSNTALKDECGTLKNMIEAEFSHQLMFVIPR